MYETTSQGFGRILVAVYAIFAVAAASRSTYQLLTRFEEARLAYLLSAFAGIIYVVATIALARDATRLALTTIGTELVGVLAVGLLSLSEPGLFPDQTVWSGFGVGYLYIPLVLPLVGLWWVARSVQAGQK